MQRRTRRPDRLAVEELQILPREVLPSSSDRQEDTGPGREGETANQRVWRRFSLRIETGPQASNRTTGGRERGEGRGRGSDTRAVRGIPPPAPAETETVVVATTLGTNVTDEGGRVGATTEPRTPTTVTAGAVVDAIRTGITTVTWIAAMRRRHPPRGLSSNVELPAAVVGTRDTRTTTLEEVVEVRLEAATSQSLARNTGMTPGGDLEVEIAPTGLMVAPEGRRLRSSERRPRK